MNKYFVDKRGRAEEYFQGGKETRKVHFPIYPKGILIKIRDLTHRRLKKLEECLEEKRHLLDEEA